MRKELKLFYKVISIETLFWVLLIVGILYFFLKMNDIRKSNPNKNQ